MVSVTLGAQYALKRFVCNRFDDLGPQNWGVPDRSSVTYIMVSVIFGTQYSLKRDVYIGFYDLGSPIDAQTLDI